MHLTTLATHAHFPPTRIYRERDAATFTDEEHDTAASTTLLPHQLHIAQVLFGTVVGHRLAVGLVRAVLGHGAPRDIRRSLGPVGEYSDRVPNYHDIPIAGVVPGKRMEDLTCPQSEKDAEVGTASIRTSYIRIDRNAVVPVLIVTDGTTTCVRRTLLAVLALLTAFVAFAVSVAASTGGFQLTRPHRPQNALLTRRTAWVPQGGTKPIHHGGEHRWSGRRGR